MDRNNNIKELITKNDSLIYSFFKDNLYKNVYFDEKYYYIYKHIVQFTTEQWSLIGKTKFNETEHIIISIIITNNLHNYSINPKEEAYVEDILHKIISYKYSMDQINNYFL